jgi:hypothetical protein
VALAGVFVRAGGAKLVRPVDAAAGLQALGVPAPTLVALALPPAELAIAVILLAVPALGGVLALAALGLFSAVLHRRIRGGTTASCACFGAARREAVSFVDLVRNGLLAILSVAALFAPGPRRPSLEAAIVVSSAVLTGILVLSMCRLRRQAGSVWSNVEAREGVRP